MDEHQGLESSQMQPSEPRGRNREELQVQGTGQGSLNVGLEAVDTGGNDRGDDGSSKQGKVRKQRRTRRILTHEEQAEVMKEARLERMRNTREQNLMTKKASDL